MNYISLGYFCSVASELERFGLRIMLSPFDWVISDFEGVISAIEHNFRDYLTYEYLFQGRKSHQIYRNTKYKINFVHDFNKYISLEKQLPEVQSKYNRRINRFYEAIKNKTLFIRYISDEEKIEGKSKELIWIENNYDHIIRILKSFNNDNDILFIANYGVTSEKIKIYNVEKDENDVVARYPFSKNTDLFEKFISINFPDKEQNIKRYKKKRSIVNRILRKIKGLLKKLFLKEYIHEKQY